MKTPRLQLWFLVLVSLLSGPPAVLAQRRPIFIDSAVSGEPDRADEAVARSRFVRVSFRNLLEGAEAGAVDLNVFPDRSLRARIERIDQFPTHTVYSGRLEGADEGEALLVVQNGVVAGSIRGGGKLFQIRFAGAGVHEVQEIDPLLLPAEDEPLVPTVLADSKASASAATAAAADDGSLIDVLVAYTAAARSAAGGTAAIEALINLGIAETNQAYVNSGAIQRVRLAGTVEVAYTESGDMGDHLNRLRLTSDGHMDQVHTLRNTLAADLVHLIVANGGGSCGIGYVMSEVSSSFASFAFAVTSRSCVSPNLTMAHEMGHNMGLQHDRHVNQSNSPYAYSHGYVNQAALVPGAPSNKRWRTIMAYNDECAANGFGCTRLMYFSDPSKSYNGDPMGVPGTASSTSPDGPANERLSLENTRMTVANFRVAAPLDSPPGTPTTLAPSGNIVDTTPTFQWLPVANATGYRLSVRKGTVEVPSHTGSYTATAAGCGTGALVCSITPSTALALGGYDFRVRATNASGSGSWSAARTFNLLQNGFNSQFKGTTAPWETHSGTWSNLSTEFLYSKGLLGSNASVSYPANFANLDYRVKLRRYGSGLNDASRIIIRGNTSLVTLNQWSQGYSFQINQNGRFSVYRNTTALKGWTASSAIKRGNAWNLLRVVAIGSSLKFYVNGVLVWSGTDTNFASGRVGIGMESGPATTGNQLRIDYATLESPTTTVETSSTTSSSTTTTSAPTTTTTSRTTTTTPTTTTSSTTTTSVSSGADMRLDSIADNPDPVVSAGVVAYTIRVTNLGPGSAPRVLISVLMPASDRMLGGTNCTGGGGFGQCSIGPLGAGKSATVTPQLQLNGAGTHTITAAVGGGTADPNTGNNQASQSTRVTTSLSPSAMQVPITASPIPRMVRTSAESRLMRGGGDDGLAEPIVRDREPRLHLFPQLAHPLVGPHLAAALEGEGSVVTKATVSAPSSEARQARMGAPLVPVPPPRPANTVSAPLIASRSARFPRAPPSGRTMSP